MDNKKNRWADRAIVYQIYPRSFKDSNNDGVGDIQGITQKLGYLNGGEDSLGVNTIWISPIYKSPMRDFGYDVADHCAIDPQFGTLEDFEQLIKEAHKRDIKVMLDYIPNHTSDLHAWFLESKSSKNNPKRDWYIWKDPQTGGSVPNNWISVFGGSGWEFDESTGQYYFHTFLKEQPDLNWRNPEVVAAMKDVLRFWLNKGVDGFRMDALYFAFKDKEFKDDPVNPAFDPAKDEPYTKLLHTHSSGRPETLDLVNDFAIMMDEYGDKFIISELVDLDAKELLPWYRAVQNGRHSPFNFKFIKLPWELKMYQDFILEFEGSLDPHHIPTYVLGNHDVPRIVSRVGYERARIAALLLLSLKGMPFIYYGEELGMEDVPIPFEKRKDPFGIDDPNSSAGRDPQRTPMQWDSSTYAGFSEHEPWLPISDNYKNTNVAKLQSDPGSLLSLYKKLIAVRKNSEALLMGRYVPIENSKLLAFLRQHQNEIVLIVLNFTEHTVNFETKFSSGIILCSTHAVDQHDAEIKLNQLILSPFEGFIIKITD